ncbi:hypothetical protein FSP39_002463 [Pinctada imbricata]|uniref:FAD-binding PCMH-type domain-containing protein n=1 Tax=Pinctada imbricata TaxID=66713 RepID=A0AA88Y656_PINIB|nr:hypothetical protein FSP39_002463 [Pinctada imbricata]
MSPILSTEDFHNWGKTQQAKVISCHPKTKDEVQKIIKAVNEFKGEVKLRCAGARHSWSPLFFDSSKQNVLIYVDKISSDYGSSSKIRISNKKNQEVDIMTGVTTGDFEKFQLKNKMNLKANVILEVVQMVSVVATGCHGVGRGTKSPSDYVIRMRIFNSDGELKTYSKEEDPAFFKAVATNFGCFGVIFDMTITLEPLMNVKTENSYRKLKDIFQNAENMKELIENNWSVELFWFPFNSMSPGRGYEPTNDEVWIRQINEEKRNVSLKGYCYYRWKNSLDCITQDALALTGPILAAHPSLTPYFSFSGFETIKHVIYREGPIYQQLPYAIHFSEAYLCPGNIGNPDDGGTGQVLYIEVLSVAGTPGWEDFCKYVAGKWLDMGGIPHLAKQWSFIPNIEKRINDKMGHNISSFKEQLEKSEADSNGIFLNDTLRKLLWATN